MQTGKRGDPFFDRYIQRLVPEYFGRPVRQNASQFAIFNLLRHTGPAVIVGHGMGGNLAMLGLDANPALVLGVIAVEPSGPPFAAPAKLDAFNNRIHLKDFAYSRGLRAYGISDVPINFDPPVNVPPILDDMDPGQDDGVERLPPIPVRKVFSEEQEAWFYLQDPNIIIRTGEFMNNRGELQQYNLHNPIRKLINISKRPVAIVTAEASTHVLHDWATVQFLKQAGVRTMHLELAKRGIHGNGHLCFLEKNSDAIADLLFRWIIRTIPSILHNAHLLPEHLLTDQNQRRAEQAQQTARGNSSDNQGPQSPADAIRRRLPGSSISVTRSGRSKIIVRWKPDGNPNDLTRGQSAEMPIELDSPTPAPRQLPSSTVPTVNPHISMASATHLAHGGIIAPQVPAHSNNRRSRGSDSVTDADLAGMFNPDNTMMSLLLAM